MGSRPLSRGILQKHCSKFHPHRWFSGAYKKTSKFLVSDCTISTTLLKTEPFYHHFIKIPQNETGLHITIQLWHLAEFRNATLKVLLSVLPLPLDGHNMRNLHSGLEIFFNNSHLGFSDTSEDPKVGSFTFQGHPKWTLVDPCIVDGLFSILRRWQFPKYYLEWIAQLSRSFGSRRNITYPFGRKVSSWWTQSTTQRIPKA